MSDIEEALAKPATSAELAAAIAMAEAEHARLDAESTTARTEALDPLAGAAQAAKCRARSEDLRFEADRMAAKLELLRKRHDNALASEAAAAKLAEYEKAKAERDALAAELIEFYPPMVTQFVDLMTRIRASDRRLALVNREMSGGREILAPAEAHARRVPANFRGPMGAVLSIAETARLPVFDESPYLAWPARDR